MLGGVPEAIACTILEGNVGGRSQEVLEVTPGWIVKYVEEKILGETPLGKLENNHLIKQL